MVSNRVSIRVSIIVLALALEKHAAVLDAAT